jgi:hypothetical protein
VFRHGGLLSQGFAFNGRLVAGVFQGAGKTKKTPDQPGEDRGASIWAAYPPYYSAAVTSRADTFDLALFRIDGAAAVRLERS